METFTASVIVFAKNYLPSNRINIRSRPRPRKANEAYRVLRKHHYTDSWLVKSSKRAIKLFVTGKAEPIHVATDVINEIRSSNLNIWVPVYIRLYNSPERNWRIPRVSRKEIFRRDKYQCQSCLNRKNLTIDHIIPRSKGGQNTWDNLVTACQACNSRQGNYTLEQVGMKLTTILIRNPNRRKTERLCFEEISKPCKLSPWGRTAKPPLYPLLTLPDNFWKEKGFGIGT